MSLSLSQSHHNAVSLLLSSSHERVQDGRNGLGNQELSQLCQPRKQCLSIDGANLKPISEYSAHNLLI